MLVVDLYVQALKELILLFKGLQYKRVLLNLVQQELPALTLVQQSQNVVSLIVAKLVFYVSKALPQSSLIVFLTKLPFYTNTATALYALLTLVIVALVVLIVGWIMLAVFGAMASDGSSGNWVPG